MIDVLFAALILAHSWYPNECCNGIDCYPIEDNRVKITPEGFVVDGHTAIPYDKARVSQDEHYHMCGTMFWPPRCFFAPRGTT